jgi:hypothetical protein
VTAQLHAQAVLDRLGASGSPALTVHDGRVPDAAVPPYVLVRVAVRNLGAAERPDASNLILQSLPIQTTVRVYSVAETARAVRAVTNRVSVALLDWTPAVTGRSCSPLRHDESFDVDPDEQTGIAYHEVVDVYRFTSHPA